MLASRNAVAARRPAPFTRARPAARISSVRVAADLKVGDKLDDYPNYYKVLLANDNSSVTLASFKGKQPVVLFFYPKAATPGCTKEACAFRDEYERFVKAGAAVFGISSDEPSVNDAFAKAQNLPYKLLSDQASILRKTFGIKADLMGLLPGRQTYVINKDGVCVLSFNDQMNAAQHVTEALQALKA